MDRDDLALVEGAHILPFSDITQPRTIEKLLQILNGRKVNSVISDMVRYSCLHGFKE